MHHWTVHAKVEFPRFPPDVRSWRVHSTTFDPELRNERFTLMYFMGFPAILSALQPFQICMFNRKNGKLTFSNGCQLVGKRFMSNWHVSLDSTCKVEFQKFPPDVRSWGGPFHGMGPFTRFDTFPVLLCASP